MRAADLRENRALWLSRPHSDMLGQKETTHFLLATSHNQLSLQSMSEPDDSAQTGRRGGEVGLLKIMQHLVESSDQIAT